MSFRPWNSVFILLLSVLIVSGHRLSLFANDQDSFFNLRFVREADNAADDASSSSSINTEQDLGGLNTAWLTDGQLSELASTEGTEERMAKLRKFYDALEGKARKGATEKIIGDCYGWLDEVASEEERDALKQMHHRDHEGCKEKVRELMGRLSQERKEQVEKRMGFCEHVWYTDEEGEGEAKHEGHEHGDGEGQHEHHHKRRWVHRHRRDHHEGHEAHHGHHNVDDYFKSHLAWLSDAQKEELKEMKTAGKSRTEMKNKVVEWYEATSGDTKERATELLKGGCRELIKLVLGEEKAQKVKEMKESGTEVAKIGEQLNTWIDEVTDEKKKELANEYRGVCAQLYGLKGPSAERTRRSWRDRYQEGEGDEVDLDEDNNDAEQYHVDGEHLHRHNSWLNKKQKKVLKKMRDRGHGDHELHERIHEFFEVSPDEVKATAKGILQRGCESILKRIFGEYKAEEIIQMREEGSSNGEIDAKITEALNQIRSPQKREEAGRFAMSCRRIFTMIERRRRSTAAGERTLEELQKSHLSWLSEAQMEELKGMREGGQGRTEMQRKVMEWYEQLEGEPRTKAREQLRGGCRELLAHIVGKDNAEELMRMREAGAKKADLEAKAQALLGAVEEEGKKVVAKEYGDSCRKLFLEGYQDA